MARTRKSALFVAAESTYGTDPSSSGAAYAYVPTFGQMGMLKDQKQLLETNYYTARNFPTPAIVGADGWAFDCEIPMNGLATAAGDGSAPAADDWFDIILQHVHGSQTSVSGEGVGTGSTTSSLVLDTDIYNVQQLVPVFEASVPTGAPRTQWALITVDAGTGTYTVAPTMTQAPSTSAVAYGTKTYQFDDDGGSSLAFVYRQDDVDYTLLGGRCTAASIIAENGQIVRMRLSFAGDTKTQEAKGSLPAITAYSRTLKTLLSPVWFNGTQYATRKIEIDLGITSAVQESTQAVNGRANYELIRAAPTVMIEPIFTNAIQDLKRNNTTGRLLVQFGAGVLASGVLNAMAFHAEQAVVMEADPVDDQGRIRSALKFQVTDPVEFSSGVSARYCQLVRA
jgi:hypothetical protein